MKREPINVKRLWLHSSNNGRYVYEKLGFKSKDSEMELVFLDLIN
jgi:hypothetical protein